MGTNPCASSIGAIRSMAGGSPTRKPHRPHRRDFIYVWDEGASLPWTLPENIWRNLLRLPATTGFAKSHPRKQASCTCRRTDAGRFSSTPEDAPCAPR